MDTMYVWVDITYTTWNKNKKENYLALPKSLDIR